MIKETTAKKLYGEVFTPPELVDEMLDKLPKDVWTTSYYKWCDPACGRANFLFPIYKRLMKGLQSVIPDDNERRRHILENMLYGCEIQENNYNDTLLILDPEDNYNLHIAHKNSLSFDFWDTKFDIVVGNPPYQLPNLGRTKDKDGSRKSLWDSFVQLSFDRLLKKYGWLCFIHPSVWRKPGHYLFKLMANKRIIYLSIHDDKEGSKIFGANTRYDWYVMQNCPTDNYTEIRDELGREWITIETLSQVPFIPNFGYNVIFKMITQFDHLPKLEAHLNTGTTVHSKHISTEPDSKHPYMVFHSFTKSNGIKVLYSAKPDPNQNKQKVLFNEGRFPIAMYDDGDYGTSNGIIYIPVHNEIEGKKIARIINSKLFKFIIAATKWSNFRTDWRMFKYLPYPQDLPLDFTDNDLYEYFKLTPDDINLIESMNK